MLNSVKYYIVCFFSILFLLSIKRYKKKINILFFLFKKSYIFWLFLFNKKFIINYEKIEKQTI